MKDYAMFTSEF